MNDRRRRRYTLPLALVALALVAFLSWPALRVEAVQLGTDLTRSGLGWLNADDTLAPVQRGRGISVHSTTGAAGDTSPFYVDGSGNLTMGSATTAALPASTTIGGAAIGSGLDMVWTGIVDDPDIVAGQCASMNVLSTVANPCGGSNQRTVVLPRDYDGFTLLASVNNGPIDGVEACDIGLSFDHAAAVPASVIAGGTASPPTLTEADGAGSFASVTFTGAQVAGTELELIFDAPADDTACENLASCVCTTADFAVRFWIFGDPS